MNDKTNAHTQHSQGPWFFDSDCTEGMAIRPARKSDGGKTGFLLACVYGSDDQCDGMFEYCGGSQEANARLIAAAPELLDASIALRGAQRAYMENRGSETIGKIVALRAAALDAAIAKATGTA